MCLYVTCVCCSGSAERLSTVTAGDLHVSAETRQGEAADSTVSDRQRHTPLQQGQQQRRRGHPELYVSLTAGFMTAGCNGGISGHFSMCVSHLQCRPS